MQKVELINKQWTRFDNSSISIYFIGYIEFKERIILTAEDFLSYFQNRKHSLSIEFVKDFLINKFISVANGNFAVIIKINNEIILICDYARTYPLYLIKEKSSIIITDHITNIKFQQEVDEIAMEEFLLAGFVTGHRTVFNNVKVLNAGEIALIHNSDVEFSRYFVLKSNPFRLKKQIDKLSIYNEIDNLFIDVFKRMIKSCSDVNNWVVPLSGGHDSRLIMNYLYRLGCENVICFSYGNPSSHEAKISKLAANALGYRWHFVEYTGNDWGKLFEEKIFSDYTGYSFNGCCLPHTQDLLAIYKLKEMSIINENDVVVPGHTAFTEAENVTIKKLSTENQSFNYVFEKYYNLFKCNDRFSTFEPTFKKSYEDGYQYTYSFPEYFNWQERQAKFINNSVRVYEFFGLKWRMPMWEKCVIDFWQNLNFDDRIERKILFDASRNVLFDNNLNKVPIIDKFSEHKETSIFKKIVYILFTEKFISIIVKFLNRKPNIAERTNLIFENEADSINVIAGSINSYPYSLRRYINRILPRKPYQVNNSTIGVIYTLRNEILNKKSEKI